MLDFLFILLYIFLPVTPGIIGIVLSIKAIKRGDHIPDPYSDNWLD